MSSLRELESRSIFILREAHAKFKRLAVLWSTGKDSTTMLWLCRKAFRGTIPFPAIHIDTGCKFPEIYAFRDKWAKTWDLRLIVAKNGRALREGVVPAKGRLACCTALKTDTLKALIEEHGFDGIIVSIRRDEHGIRAKERTFSPRDGNSRWDYAHQRPELWDIYVKPSGNVHHTRIHPLLHWSELDTWRYVAQEGMPANPLYFARDGRRYRSLGCMPCTVPVVSNARTLKAVIKELEKTDVAERSGRCQDKEREYAMQKLRSLGYL